MKKFRFSAVMMMAAALIVTGACKKKTTDEYTSTAAKDKVYSLSYAAGDKSTLGTIVLNHDTINVPAGQVVFNITPYAAAAWTIYDLSWTQLFQVTGTNQMWYNFTPGWYHLTCILLPAINFNDVWIHVGGTPPPPPPPGNSIVRYMGSWYNQNTNEDNYVFRGPKVYLTATQLFQVGDIWNNGFTPVFSGMNQVGTDSIDIEIKYPAKGTPSLKKFCYGGTVGGSNLWVANCTGVWHNGLSGPGNDLFWFNPAYGTAVPYNGNTNTVPGAMIDNNGNWPAICNGTLNSLGDTLHLYLFNPPMSYGELIGTSPYVPSVSYQITAYGGTPGAIWNPIGFQYTSINKSYLRVAIPVTSPQILWVMFSKNGAPSTWLMGKSQAWDANYSVLKIII